MELTDYKKAYFNTLLSIHQSRMIALSASDALEDFPRNLPQKTEQHYLLALTKMEEVFAQPLDAKRTQDGISSKSEGMSDVSIPVGDENPFLFPTIGMSIAQVGLGMGARTISFNSILQAQELVMLFAHLDAFMADSMRAVLRREPRLLRRAKKLSWEEILDCNNWDALQEKMIEDSLYEFGWKSLDDRIKYLRTELNLTIGSKLDYLLDIAEAEKIRHIAIHNGSRVSQEYINRTGRKDVKIGDVLPITSEYTGQIGAKITALCGSIFKAVAEKFFHARREDFVGILGVTDD